MRDAFYCVGCDNLDYCEHTSMRFCMVEVRPAWMALDDFWDSELSECSKRESIDSDKKRKEI